MVRRLKQLIIFVFWGWGTINQGFSIIYRFSKAFYTSVSGYKMCLGVFPGGNGEGRGMHISLFIHLMKGESDSQLKWPFRGSVVIEMLNQQADHTHLR